eukprot:119323-Chlamydomonas_euryale.AAC.1
MGGRMGGLEERCKKGSTWDVLKHSNALMGGWKGGLEDGCTKGSTRDALKRPNNAFVSTHTWWARRQSKAAKMAF